MARLFPSFRPRSSAVAAGLAVWALLIAPVEAQQLISDGDFDGTLGSWTDNSSDALLTLGAIDATGCAPDSVSARAESSTPAASEEVDFLRNCISGIDDGQTYSFGGRIRYITGQATTGFAAFSVGWLEACDGLNIGVDFSAPTVTTDSAGTWVESRLALEAPNGATAADLRLRLTKNEAGGTLEALFDRVYFALGDLVFADDFEIQRTCRWSDASP